jgi:hypothetical protein
MPLSSLLRHHVLHHVLPLPVCHWPFSTFKIAPPPLASSPSLTPPPQRERRDS